MEMLGSLAIKSARKAALGAGEALAVDRDIFAAEMTTAIESHPLIRLHREEILALPDNPKQLTILATGPLTSPALTESLRRVTGEGFYFYDAISPIIDAQSLNMEIIFAANRYGKDTRSLDGSESSEGDYLNCPFNKEQYESFIDLLLRGERVEAQSFERVKHFEGCMPVEEMADRGRDTLRFGPMKPVGLVDPKTGREPWAAVQLRAENKSKTAFNIVGFQTKLKYGEQTKVFRSIPGLENAEFLRLGSMHRNSFVDAPRVLQLDLSLREARHVMLAGQITGVEGYMESAATGIMAGLFAEARMKGRPIADPPAGSAFGALLGHLRGVHKTDFQPSSINFGLFEDSSFSEELNALKLRFPKKIPKDERRKAMAEASLKNAESFAGRILNKA
jgi:methylenetetrahydrofolate--tRNA-(uracil-5-)-methyltransferase